MSGFGSLEEVKAFFGLTSDATDLVGLRTELLDRAKVLDESEPGNGHPHFATITAALELVKAAESSENSAPVPAVPPRAPAVRRLNETQAVERAIVPAESPALRATAMADTYMKPVRRTFRNRSWGLGAITAVSAFMFAAPRTLADNPWLGDWITDEQGDPVAVVGLGWIAVMAACGAAWLLAWMQERRTEQRIERLMEPDAQTRLAREFIGGQGYFDSDELGDLLAAYSLGIREPSHAALSGLSEENRKAAWNTYYGRVHSARRRLNSDEQRALAAATEDAVNRFVALGWLERDPDYPFSEAYNVIGEVDY